MLSRRGIAKGSAGAPQTRAAALQSGAFWSGVGRGAGALCGTVFDGPSSKYERIVKSGEGRHAVARTKPFPTSLRHGLEGFGVRGYKNDLITSGHDLPSGNTAVRGAARALFTVFLSLKSGCQFGGAGGGWGGGACDLATRKELGTV
jgi:hypothetical protein